MKLPLPQITLNGNLKTWLAFFLFLGGAVTLGAGFGSWSAGLLSDVAQGKGAAIATAALADSMGSVSKKVGELSEQLAKQGQITHALTVQMAELSRSVDESKRSTDRLNRVVRTEMATKEWINGLLKDADNLHDSQDRRIRDLERKNRRR